MKKQAKPKSPLLHKWVPKWLGVVMFIFLFVPAMFVNGAYTSNAGEMVSGLGIISEHIQFANFVSAIGMVVTAPFLISILSTQRPKVIYLIGFSLLFLLSVISAETLSMPVLFLCSFFMGVLRIILILNTMFTLLGYLTGMDILAAMVPKDDNSEDPEMSRKKDRLKSLALPVVYFFFVSLGQLGSTLTAWLAHEYEWQHVYWFLCGFILIALLLVLLLMKYQPKKKNVGKIDSVFFGDMVAASLLLASGCYILVYGKTLDWFDHPTIRLAGIILLITIGFFIFLAAYSKRPYVNLKVFKLRRVNIALLFFFLLMIINSSSMLLSTFVGVSMKIDNWQNAILNNYALVGYLIGMIISFIMVKKEIHFRYMFATGFVFITVSAVYMYFHYQNMGVYQDMIFPVIARSTGMLILYALCGIYGLVKLPMGKFIASWIFLMLAVRSVIAPALGSSLYSNVINERTQHYISRLSHDVDRMNPEAAATYQSTHFGAMTQGKSYEEAEQLAAITIKGKVQVQAVLVTLKEVTGWTIFFGVGCVALALFFPYDKRQRLKKEGCKRA